ncbi:Aste57867_16322 [Aphanomyces stellatus]|uniref:Aste57867_16322 protein n=1 Tax=Aphanomyces stellatus TaxID=120398 RepID=A0A485L5E5_9STRA|nr:hypothetical protein As57867_016265 [Aphanomyces stellatus]VFT93098.1 Aste57867_16322 [Aphanomyces stellatus]
MLDDLASTREAFLLFGVLGFTYLFALDALLQPVDYWRLLFPAFNAEFEISWVYNCATVTTLVALVVRAATNSAAPIALARRIVVGFCVLFLLLVALPASAFVLSTTTARLAMVLTSTAVIAVAIATIDSTMFALASRFPVGAVEYIQLGIGCSLLVSALYRVASKALFASDHVVEATMAYFGVAACTVALGLVAFDRLHRLPLTQRCLQPSHNPTTPHDVAATWGKIWFHEAMVALCNATTYVVYPGVVTSIRSHTAPAARATSGWWPLVLMTSYAGADALGRFCVRWRLGWTHRHLWILVFPRLLLIPLLVAAARATTPWLAHNSIALALVALLGLSNGYVGTLAIVVVNDIVEPHEQTITGMCASLSVNVGLFVGATLGLALAHLLDL